MFKFAVLALVASLAVKAIFGRWPWEYLRADSHRQEAARARSLLGVGANATQEEILAAHKQLVALVHPDRGGSNEAIYAANEARDLLINRLRESK